MTDENRHYDIDEMLNAYLDGELSERQQTEVQRLIAHDSVIAEKFVQLQRQAELIKTLPSEKAPADVLYKTRQSLEKRALLGTDAHSVAERAGEKELYMRKMISAAAMIALVAALFIVVYTILSPTKPPAEPVAGEFPTPTIEKVTPKEIAPETPVPVVSFMPFYARLEISTGQPGAVNSVVTKALETNSFATSSPQRLVDRTIYYTRCSKESLPIFLAELEKAWPKFNSADFYLETQTMGSTVAVKNVTTEQIIAIAGAEDFLSRQQHARKFAAQNEIQQLKLSNRYFAASEIDIPESLVIEKPVLTGNNGEVKTESLTEENANLNLTIIITGK